MSERKKLEATMRILYKEIGVLHMESKCYRQALNDVREQLMDGDSLRAIDYAIGTIDEALNHKESNDE